MNTTTGNVTILPASGLVVTADDITSALKQNDATAASIDSAVDACTNIDPLARTQWKTFYAGYKTFSQANQNLGFFTLGLPNIGDQVVAYEGQLAAWYQVLAKQCKMVMPTPAQPHADKEVLGTGTKFLIGAGIAVAGLFVLMPLINQVAIAMQARRKS